MPKAKLAEVDVRDGVLYFRFADGGPDLVADPAVLSPEQRQRLLVHGLEQKLRDAYAGADSPAEARGLASKVWDALTAGQWTVRTVRYPRPYSDSLLAEAVVAAAAAAGRTLDPAAVRARIAGMDKSAKAKLRNDPRVAMELARLRGKSSSLDELF